MPTVTVTGSSTATSWTCDCKNINECTTGDFLRVGNLLPDGANVHNGGTGDSNTGGKW